MATFVLIVIVKAMLPMMMMAMLVIMVMMTMLMMMITKLNHLLATALSIFRVCQVEEKVRMVETSMTVIFRAFL